MSTIADKTTVVLKFNTESQIAFSCVCGQCHCHKLQHANVCCTLMMLLMKNHIKIFDIYSCQSCNFDEHCLHLHVLCMQIMNNTIKEQLASLQWNFWFLVEDIVFMNSLPAGFSTCEIQLYANVTSHFLLTKKADKLKS